MEKKKKKTFSGLSDLPILVQECLNDSSRRSQKGPEQNLNTVGLTYLS